MREPPTCVMAKRAGVFASTQHVLLALRPLPPGSGELQKRSPVGADGHSPVVSINSPLSDIVQTPLCRRINICWLKILKFIAIPIDKGIIM